MPSLEGKCSYRLLWTGFFLFFLALVLRILFLLATPDADGPYSPWYIGDTPTWLDYAQAIQTSRPFDLGLPMRPPGVAYLVAAVWNGQESGFLFLKLFWAFLGAVMVAGLYTAVLRSFGLKTAVVSALIAAASTSLLILSTSLNNEIPYLLLLMTSFILWEPIRHRPRLRILFFWSALHGLACLIRVEHLLFFALVSAYLVWAWSRLPEGQGGWNRSLGRAAIMLSLFILPILPWQLHIFEQIERFNREPSPANQATEQAYLQLEQALSGLRWTEEADREKAALPAFCRRPISNFITATVALRGGTEVTGESFRIIEEAFGSYPEPIDAYPFVAIYGGLNFHLANNPRATGGFSLAPLEAPPPLAGGPSQYPGFLIAGLPPPELALTYPPHLQIVNHGYRLGRDWILNHPGDYLSLAWNKLRIFWAGATLGLTGYNLPLGLSGVRRPVDLVVPDNGPGVVLWRWAGLAMVLAGLWAGRREEALIPWLLLLATKIVTTLGFFGYAREGAVVFPVIALSMGLLFTRGLPRLRLFSGLCDASRGVRAGFRMSCVLALMLITVEAYRWHSKPEITLEGRQPGAVEVLPGMEYEERRLRVR